MSVLGYHQPALSPATSYCNSIAATVTPSQQLATAQIPLAVTQQQQQQQHSIATFQAAIASSIATNPSNVRLLSNAGLFANRAGLVQGHSKMTASFWRSGLKRRHSDGSDFKKNKLSELMQPLYCKVTPFTRGCRLHQDIIPSIELAFIQVVFDCRKYDCVQSGIHRSRLRF